MALSLPVEGWYPDPTGVKNNERFWDGSEWTANVRVVPLLLREVDAQELPAEDVDTGLDGEAVDVEVVDGEAVDNEVADIDAVGDGAVDVDVVGIEADSDHEEQAAVVNEDAGSVAAAGVFGVAVAGSAPVVVESVDEEVVVDPATTQEDLHAVETGNNSFEGSLFAPVAAKTASVDSSLSNVSSELFADPYRIGDGDRRVATPNEWLLQVLLGEDVLAKPGSKVASRGTVKCADEQSNGSSKLFKKTQASNSMRLDRYSGTGELFLADESSKVFVIDLDGGEISVSSASVLALEPSLSLTVEKVRTAGVTSAGLLSAHLAGTGWVAITSAGEPSVLSVKELAIVDISAVLAWSASLQLTVETVKGGAPKSLSGDRSQVVFHGEGLVVLQPAIAAEQVLFS